jgi:hypothetical protein
MRKTVYATIGGVLVVGLAVAGTVLAQTTAPKPLQGTTLNTTIKPKLPVKVDCPVAQITVGVKAPGQLPSPWWDTPFLESLDRTELTTVGGQPGIRCWYRGSGREWDIARPLEPNYASCTPQGKSFSCVLK